jgi:hypothetical protein
LEVVGVLASKISKNINHDLKFNQCCLLLTIAYKNNLDHILLISWINLNNLRENKGLVQSIFFKKIDKRKKYYFYIINAILTL